MRPVFVLLLSLLGCAADPSIAPSVTPEPAPVMPPAPSMPSPGPVALPHAVQVQKIEVAGSLAKIAWPIADGGLSDATVRGWVDARLLAPLPKPSGGEMVGGALGLEGTSHWTGCARSIRCTSTRAGPRSSARSSRAPA